VVLAAALALYVASVAPGPLWQDNGLAQIRTLRQDLRGDLGLALSHPLYYVLTIAFQGLPLAESALKTNLVAATFGAVTVANAFLLLRLVTRRRAAAVIGALSLAVAHTFWQHCALAEVYTVSTTLLLGELLCLNQFARTGRKLWLLLLFLINGLGVSNHLLAALNLPVWAVLLLWLLVRRRISPGTLVAVAGAWLAGAALYLGLVVAEIAGGRPAVEVLRSALFGEGYAANVLNLRLSPRLLLNAGLYLGLNFPTPVALLALCGVTGLRRLAPHPLGWVLGSLVAIHLLWAVHYNVADQYTFFIFPVVLISLLIGLGADWLLGRAGCPRSPSRGNRRRTAILIGLAALPALVYIPLPQAARAIGLSLGVGREVPYRDRCTFFLWPWKTGYQGARRFADGVQQALPDGAVLIADDTTVRPIHYQMLVGRWSKRVAVWPPLAGTGGGGNVWPEEGPLSDQLDRGLVYVVTPQAHYCPAWLLRGAYAFERAGPVYRVLRAPGDKQ
jgi:hypothetical protein